MTIPVKSYVKNVYTSVQKCLKKSVNINTDVSYSYKFVLFLEKCDIIMHCTLTASCTEISTNQSPLYRNLNQSRVRCTEISTNQSPLYRNLNQSESPVQKSQPIRVTHIKKPS